MTTDLVGQVQSRAKNRCEYCSMHQALQGGTFHIEHIVPSSRGGPTELDNPALACPKCNLHKSDREKALDPDTGVMVPLFNPRNSWTDHFQWAVYLLEGKTPEGRATIILLDLNHPRRVRIRQAEELFGLFPP
jgi:hypothetical protein